MVKNGDGRWGLEAVLCAALVVITLTVTAALVRITFVKFDAMSTESGQLVLTQQILRGSDMVTGLLDRARGHVDAAALAVPGPGPGEQEATALHRQWIAALAVERSIQSFQLTRTDGRFYQAVTLRGNTGLATALGAPDGARFATRSVQAPYAAGGRLETWRFLDAAGNVLAKRQGTTGFDGWQDHVTTAVMARADALVSKVEPFFTTRGTGITVARRLADGSGVVAAQIAQADLDALFAGMSYAPHTVGALVDPSGRIVAAGAGAGASAPASGGHALALASGAHGPLLNLERWRAAGPTPEVRVEDIAGEAQVMAQSSLEFMPGERWRVLAYAPAAQIFGFMFAARDRLALLALLVLATALFTSLVVAKRAVGALKALTQDALRLSSLDFGPAPRVRSRLQEFSTLADAHEVMRESLRAGTQDLHRSRRRLEELIDAGLSMSRERNMMDLLHQILWGAKRLTRCDAATLFIVTEHRTLKFALRTRDDPLPNNEIPLDGADGRENLHFVSVYAALRNQPVVIEDVYTETRFDLDGTRSFDERTGYRTVSMLALPLAPREGEVIGVLQLMNALDPITGKAVPFSAEDVQLAMALAAQAAVSLDNHQLVQAQAGMVDSMVQLLAGAIDAKSPYTGGHCARVPELAVMLAEEATRVHEGPLAAFRFETPDQWREFRIGAWLHDCGKITTPEYVVDKATKLETLYDRIHEIRTRFEVLWRDAEIDHLKSCLIGGDMAASRAQRDERHAQLQEDFAFVARCNVGTESMDAAHVTRLHGIGSQIWWRHFDDRAGLSHEMLALLDGVAASPLPAMERLLQDKPQHIVPRPATPVADPVHGFKMDIPEHLYNRGELHNLSIRSGTLTPEERYKIQEHITQTILMLESMQFPKNLRRVPEYAGTHHETLKGNGYPRQLTAEQLSVPARIMAVADIFEALTAVDRPYKKSKSLSEAVEILWGFKRRGHIDADIFDLFLTSGVYLRFAQKFLPSELIDHVDIERYIGPVPVPPQRAAQSMAGLRHAA